MSDELKRVEKQILKLRILFTPGPVLVGLGLYGLIWSQGTKPDGFLAIFQNPVVSKTVLALGIVSVLAEFLMLRPLWAKRKALESS